MDNVEEHDLVSDKDMYLFLESAKRGGVSVISKRYAKCNVPGTENYNPAAPTKYLTYKDMNNLYGHAMVQPLPTGEFRWVTASKEEILNTPDDAEHGYILEVDLAYPSYLHDMHNDYPLAAEHLTIDSEMLSPLQSKIHEQKKTPSTKKLAPNLMDKKNYIIHYRNLKYYLEQGMILQKVHRVLKFKQSPWLKPFIDFNTAMRAKATSDFEKDFFKLMNNSVFGKTIENTREYRNVDFVSSEHKAQQLAAQPNYRSSTILHENLIAVERYKTTVKMNKPIYTGVTVFELSKLFMYQFYYDYIKKTYPGDKSKLCMTDTDSFILEIETEDLYKDMLSNHELFDFSGYSSEHSMFQGLSTEDIKNLREKNRKVLGKMKDEMMGLILLEYVGVRSKAYSLKHEKMEFVDEHGKISKKPTKQSKLVIAESEKLKGIKKSTVEKNIHHEHFLACVNNDRTLHAQFNSFRSYNHKMTTITQNKLALCNFDDKRWIEDDGINTYAYGHYKLRK